jgi:uncharacterized protein (DUF488 family)
MPKIFTVGHSTRSAGDFLALVKSCGIELLVDIRTIPHSRRNPQFETAALRSQLEQNGIAYFHEPALGGLRHPRKDSPNGAWKNASFRGYADYMQTPLFAKAIEQLTHLAVQRPTVIMCAEAVPWRCHRSLVADALLLQGLQVVDILSENKSADHQLTPWARVQDGAITYPPAQPLLENL